MRNENNIGETNKTSVKVHHGPGGQSNWSLGWGEEEKPKPGTTFVISVKKYHNQSSVTLGGENEALDEEERKRKELEKKKKEEELNQKLPTYDPKNGGRSNLHFGDEKTDYRRKDEVFTSVKVHNPPGGKSSIQFG